MPLMINLDTVFDFSLSHSTCNSPVEILLAIPSESIGNSLLAALAHATTLSELLSGLTGLLLLSLCTLVPSEP